MGRYRGTVPPGESEAKTLSGGGDSVTLEVACDGG